MATPSGHVRVNDTSSGHPVPRFPKASLGSSGPGNAGWPECAAVPSRQQAAVGHTLLSVFLDSGQLRSRQVLHATDELWTAAKARPDLGVAGTRLPPGEDSPFQRPEHPWVGRRTRPTIGPRTQGQDLEHTPSAAPESPGHLGRVDTGRYEAAYPPLNRAASAFRWLQTQVRPPLNDIGRLLPGLSRRIGMANPVEMTLVGAGRLGVGSERWQAARLSSSAARDAVSPRHKVGEALRHFEAASGSTIVQ
jgi:hypothetical protein